MHDLIEKMHEAFEELARIGELMQSEVAPRRKTMHDLIEKMHEAFEGLTRIIVLMQSEVVPREENMPTSSGRCTRLSRS